MTVKVLSLPEAPIDDQSRQYAEEIAALDGVIGVQLLPDTLTKDKYIGLDYKVTVPSSSAIVTEEHTLYPQFRSRGINCGMMAVALPVTEETSTDLFIRELLHALTYDPLYYLLYRLRLPWYAKSEDLSYENLITVFEGDGVQIKDVAHLLNTDWLEKRTARMRRSVGRYFGGNHYFELQVAENDCPELDIKKGQLTAMFHTGCEGIQSVVRKDLADKYFYQPNYIPAEKGGEMYEAFFVAQGMLQRYTTHYRHATKSIVDRVLKKHHGKESTVIVNKGHNSVEREAVNGVSRLVYRHNAERLVEGDLAIVSGMYDFPSHIVRGGSDTEAYYNTIDHGLGMVLKRDEKKSVSNDKFAKLYRYRHGIRQLGSAVESVPMVESHLAKKYFELLEEKNIATDILSLRPILNMKHTK